MKDIIMQLKNHKVTLGFATDQLWVFNGVIMDYNFEDDYVLVAGAEGQKYFRISRILYIESWGEDG